MIKEMKILITVLHLQNETYTMSHFVNAFTKGLNKEIEEESFRAGLMATVSAVF